MSDTEFGAEEEDFESDDLQDDYEDDEFEEDGDINTIDVPTARNVLEYLVKSVVENPTMLR